MNDLDKNRILAEKISAVLQSGIKVARASLHFIDSTFDSGSVEGLNRILADTDDCDALTIYELLLFPDESIQIQIEAVLRENDYLTPDLAEICRMVLRANPSIHFSLPDDRIIHGMSIPESVVIKFIQRLNILNQVDASFDQTLIRCIPDHGDYLKARVRLRNRRFEFTEAILDFLTALIEKNLAAPSFFWDAIDYMIEFFNTYPSIQDIESALMEKRRVCIQMLDLAEKNDKALAENAVETLLMRGARIMPVCIEEIKKEIDLIDAIRFTVDARPVEFLSP